MGAVTNVELEFEREKLLLASVIRRAAYDIVEYRGSNKLKHKKLWRDAYEWMFYPPETYDDPDDELMSFLNICEILKANPEYIRQRTRLMSKQEIKRYQMVDFHNNNSCMTINVCDDEE